MAHEGQKRQMAGFTNDVMDVIYPVGSICLTVTTQDPHQELGYGTWVEFAKGVALGTQLNFILATASLPPNATIVCYLFRRTA